MPTYRNCSGLSNTLVLGIKISQNLKKRCVYRYIVAKWNSNQSWIMSDVNHADFSKDGIKHGDVQGIDRVLRNVVAGLHHGQALLCH